VTRSIDAVLFDFGGVLVREGSGNDFARMAPDADAELVIRVALGYSEEDGDHPWHRVERGELAMAEWFALTCASLETHGVILQPLISEGPFAFTPSEPMLELVRDARTAGCATAIVTNNARELAPVWRPALPIDELFDVVIDSSEVGMRKPGAAIFNLTLERLGGVDPARAAFLDDVQVNVDGARRAGLHAWRVESDPSDAIAAVRELLGSGG
jgi:putative hydrolase of the HAD superfamily